MNIEDITVGMEVIINKNCSSTSRSYGLNYNMETMRGHVFIVQNIVSPDIVVVQGWNWHPNDLSPFKFEYKEFNTGLNKKAELFDPNNLEL